MDRGRQSRHARGRGLSLRLRGDDNALRLCQKARLRLVYDRLYLRELRHLHLLCDSGSGRGLGRLFERDAGLGERRPSALAGGRQRPEQALGQRGHSLALVLTACRRLCRGGGQGRGEDEKHSLPRALSAPCHSERHSRLHGQSARPSARSRHERGTRRIFELDQEKRQAKRLAQRALHTHGRHGLGGRFL